MHRVDISMSLIDILRRPNSRKRMMKITGVTLYRTTEAGRLYHAHTHYQLHFVVSGSGAYEVKGRRPIGVQAGTLFVIPPNLAHRISLPRNISLLEYLIDMAIEDESDPVKKLLDNELGALRTFAGISMNRKFFESKREQFNGDNPYERQVAVLGLLSWLYSFCSRHFGAKYLETDERLDEVELALEILQNHIEKDINLETLARQVGINRFSLVRKFSRQVGVSPMKYFARLKLECAARLLQGDELSVGEVSEKLGFSDQFHFSKRFKAAYAVSPARYREHARTSGRH
jgi:AraC-like DNA-binding protein/mannose-6-phosphate isomerase-like protein (cupin superfamily)